MKIQEIAKLAGVSTATVSRVFSHHPSIRPEVREHVFAVARQYGYHPRLSTRQRNVVILTPYHSVYPVQSCVDMILMALTQELPRRNFRLEILPVNNRERLDSIQFCAAVAIGRGNRPTSATGRTGSRCRWSSWTARGRAIPPECISSVPMKNRACASRSTICTSEAAGKSAASSTARPEPATRISAGTRSSGR